MLRSLAPRLRPSNEYCTMDSAVHWQILSHITPCHRVIPVQSSEGSPTKRQDWGSFVSCLSVRSASTHGQAITKSQALPPSHVHAISASCGIRIHSSKLCACSNLGFKNRKKTIAGGATRWALNRTKANTVTHKFNQCFSTDSWMIFEEHHGTTNPAVPASFSQKF